MRCICPNCKQPYQASVEELKLCGLSSAAGTTKLARGQGCAACRQSGFRGRTGIFEITPVTPALSKLIMQTSPTEDMQQLAVKEGMTTLRQDGIAKALAGEATLAEVIRVTRD